MKHLKQHDFKTTETCSVVLESGTLKSCSDKATLPLKVVGEDALSLRASGASLAISRIPWFAATWFQPCL